MAYMSDLSPNYVSQIGYMQIGSPLSTREKSTSHYLENLRTATFIYQIKMSMSSFGAYQTIKATNITSAGKKITIREILSH